MFYQMNKATVSTNQQLSEQAAQHLAELGGLKNKLTALTREKDGLDVQLQARLLLLLYQQSSYSFRKYCLYFFFFFLSQ